MQMANAVAPNVSMQLTSLWTGGICNVSVLQTHHVAQCAEAACVVAAQLVPVVFGIRKMQITAVIEDAKVESMDSIIEEEIVRDGESEYIQSIDVVSFNKL